MMSGLVLVDEVKWISGPLSRPRLRVSAEDPDVLRAAVDGGAVLRAAPHLLPAHLRRQARGDAGRRAAGGLQRRGGAQGRARRAHAPGRVRQHADERHLLPGGRSGLRLGDARGPLRPGRRQVPGRDLGLGAHAYKGKGGGGEASNGHAPPANGHLPTSGSRSPWTARAAATGVPCCGLLRASAGVDCRAPLKPPLCRGRAAGAHLEAKSMLRPFLCFKI